MQVTEEIIGTMVENAPNQNMFVATAAAVYVRVHGIIMFCGEVAFHSYLLNISRVTSESRNCSFCIHTNIVHMYLFFGSFELLPFIACSVALHARSLSHSSTLARI